MSEKIFHGRLNPFLVSTLFFILGGLWILITLYLFTRKFPDPEWFRRWELVLCLFPLLILTGLVYLLVNHTTQRQILSQQSLQRVNRALKVRSECSQHLIRDTDEHELMCGICRIIVDSEGYLLAWVGLALDDVDRTVLPVAQWGDEKGYLESLKVSWAENEHGVGPTGMAIRSGEPCVAQHIRTDVKWAPWRKRALQYGYASSISLPLSDQHRVFGALVIFAGEPDAFDPREVTLLQALADDLSYGMTTLRLRQERERAKQEQMLLATIVEQESDGVLTFGTDGLVQYVNPAFEVTSGYYRDELMGVDIRELASREPEQNIFSFMASALTCESGRSERSLNRRKDGTLYDVETRLSPVCGAGGTTAYAAVIRDLTHEVQLERQLCQAQKMEAIATLAGGIAHDFNNILASIITNAEMAQDYASGNEPLDEHLAIVLKAGFRAKNLVKQILTLSCQNEQEWQPVRLDLIARECMKLLRASLPTTMDIQCCTTEGLGMVLADPTQIHQVLMNLATNAADAMRERGGTLEIQLKNVDMEAGDLATDPLLPAGRYLRLCVADTGHGMDRKTAARIFDPFFTTKEPGRGTGLGLSVVRGIVKNHDGGIAVSSEPGKGTTFQVLLPRIDRTAHLPECEELNAVPGGKERILFLDDEEDLAFAGQKMLEKLGYEVVAGTSSRDALEVFRAQPERFDLVITDLTMPYMTGDQLASEIFRIRPDIPLILCTGLGQSAIGGFPPEKASAMGICDVLMKPIERLELARVIRRVLDQPA